MLHLRPTAPALSRRIAADLVDVALVLAADCSGSIRTRDLTLQFQGYARAVTSRAFLETVGLGRYGRVALTFVGWSSVGRQDQIVPWTLIDGAASAGRFAATLLETPGPTPGFTSISGAIDFARRLLSTCVYPSGRQVIDISGDGANNDGRPVTEARDEAIAAGIMINGLPIVRDEPDIANYYSRNVIGGSAAFVVVAEDMASFQSAVLEKFVAEVAALPARTTPA